MPWAQSTKEPDLQIYDEINWYKVTDQGYWLLVSSQKKAIWCYLGTPSWKSQAKIAELRQMEGIKQKVIEKRRGQ